METLTQLDTSQHTPLSEEMSPDVLDVSDIHLISKISGNTPPSKTVLKCYSYPEGEASPTLLAAVARMEAEEEEAKILNPSGKTTPYPGFSNMLWIDYRYLSRCVKNKLEHNEFAIFMFLAGQADDDGLICISQKAISKVVGIDHNMTVSRSIQKLVKMGLIEIDSSHKKYHTNVYRIMNYIG